MFYLISCKGHCESRFFRTRFDTPVSDSREYDLTMNRLIVTALHTKKKRKKQTKIQPYLLIFFKWLLETNLYFLRPNQMAIYICIIPYLCLASVHIKYIQRRCHIAVVGVPVSCVYIKCKVTALHQNVLLRPIMIE